MDKLCWSEDLQCHWSAWRVVGERHVVLELPHLNKSDGRGVIKVAQFLCPDVEAIDIYRDGIHDVVYRFNHDEGKWESLCSLEYHFRKMKGESKRSKDEFYLHPRSELT